MNILDHEVYMNIAREYSKLSKCQFTKVGAIAINERKRIIATGVNGTIPGHENCSDHHFDHRDDHIQFTTQNELHAELNLILDMVKSGSKFRSLSIYITISPCYECLKAILGLTDYSNYNTITIDMIVYDKKYHRMSDEELDSMVLKAKKAGTKLISIDQLRKELK